MVTSSSPSPPHLESQHIRQLVNESAIRPDIVTRLGARSVTRPADLPRPFRGYGDRAVPALVLPWNAPDGTVVDQLRPDQPVISPDGTVQKYLWPKDVSSTLSHVQAGQGTVVLVEGWKQSAALASWCESDLDVYAFLGAWNVQSLGDLSFVENRDVILVFDADLSHNFSVHTAAKITAEKLDLFGASSVKFARLPGSKKSTQGVDDFLSKLQEDNRKGFITRLLDRATTRLGRAPAKPKKHDPPSDSSNRGPHQWFNEDGLRVRDFAQHVLSETPALLTKEHTLVLFRDGAYASQINPWRGVSTRELGNLFTVGHERNTLAQAEGILIDQGRFLPETLEKPLISCQNGVILRLWDGETEEWTPDYQSMVRLPVDWDPEATCPLYEAWLRSVAGDQVDDLEESVSTFLDLTTTPQKAVVLYGPTRAGKSMFIRLIQAIAGTVNTSAVSLHELARDPFATANLYGKILNVCADLSSVHVEDISRFKKMTGDDIVHANRKYGSQFPFTNQALFLFSANRLPTVGESSRAYAARIKAFKFGNSFEGGEKPYLEEYIMKKELPGILVRLVRAFQRFLARGRRYQEGNDQIREEFEQKSDRVVRWVNEQCVITPTNGQNRLDDDKVTTSSVLYRSFMDWVKEEGGVTMTRSTFTDRLLVIPGVEKIRSRTGTRGLNMRVDPLRAPGHEDSDPITMTAPETDLDAIYRALSDPSTSSTSSAPPAPLWEQMELPFPDGDEDPPSGDDGAGGSGRGDDPVVPSSSGPDLPEELPGEEEAEELTLVPRSSVTERSVEEVSTSQGIPEPDIREFPEGYLSLDLETATNKVYAPKGWPYQGPFIRLAGFLKGGQTEVRITTDIDEVIQAIEQSRVIVGHNVASFDLLALFRFYELDLDQFIEGGQKRLVDTKYLGILRDPPLSRQKKGWAEKYYSLHEQAIRLGWEGKAHDLKALIKKHGGADQIPVDDPEYREYLRQDVLLTAKLDIAFEKEIREKSREFRVNISE